MGGRRSEGDALPGWSAVIQVDRAKLGLEPERPATARPADEDPDERTRYDGEEHEDATAPSPPVPARARVATRVDPPLEEVRHDERTLLDGEAQLDLAELVRRVKAPEPTFTDAPTRQDSAGELAGEETLLDSPIESLRPRSARGAVLIEGVEGERIPAVIVRRLAPAAPPQPTATPPKPADPLLHNAPVVGAGELRIGQAAAELTQINAAAALGIAPEPAPPPSANAPAALGGADEKTPPPVLERIDFGALKLEDRPSVGARARYLVELGRLDDLDQRVAGTKTLAKLIPIVIAVGVMIGLLAIVLVSPLGDMLQLGRRSSLQAEVKRRQAAAGAGNGQLPNGSIRVITKPARGAIEVDEFYIGRSPLLLAPPEDRPYYEIKVLLANHRTWSGRVHINEAGGYTVVRNLESDSKTNATIAPDGPTQFQLTVPLEPLDAK